MRILAVDDDDIALDLLRAALKDSGYKSLTTATSAAEALDIIGAAETPFDIFLLDIQMPGMNGIELCERIRDLPAYYSAPIIMITAMQERHYIDGAFLAGAIDYVSKPFDPLELVVRIGIAERLSKQAHRVDESETEVAFLKSRTGVGMDFGIGDAITIRDVPRVISMTAMENYLLRLTYWMAINSKSVVFSIEGFEAIHAQCNPADLYDILSDTAAVIVSCLKHTTHLVTYVGHGRFVAVVNGRSSEIGEDTRVAIQSVMDENQPYLSTGRPCPITLEMGEVYSPGIWSAPNRLSLLLRPQSRDFLHHGGAGRRSGGFFRKAAAEQFHDA